jgi:hypothetical protein
VVFNVPLHVALLVQLQGGDIALQLQQQQQQQRRQQREPLQGWVVSDLPLSASTPEGTGGELLRPVGTTAGWCRHVIGFAALRLRHTSFCSWIGAEDLSSGATEMQAIVPTDSATGGPLRHRTLSSIPLH